MEFPESARLQLLLAIAQLDHAADTIGVAACSFSFADMTEDEKTLRDYYLRVSLSLHESAKGLRTIAAQEHREP